MGMITIETRGSFGNKSTQFSAMEHGHADAVAMAIEYLAKELLPEATAQDHELHEQGHEPDGGFKRTAP